MEQIGSWVSEFAEQMLSLLPTSPFRGAIEAWVPPEGYQYVSWFLPVHDFLAIVAIWAVAVGIYYACSIVMRWIKIIGD